MDIPIGRCSICKGVVYKPEFWAGNGPVTVSCSFCGATKSDCNVPTRVIDMEPKSNNELPSFKR